MDEPPTSSGRVFLARAFAHWCVLHQGSTPEEIAVALDLASEATPSERRHVRFAARLLGELAAAGELRGFARPLGGGTPTPLPAATWERDDFRSLFRRSALDPTRPFDDDAAVTHWVFFDLEDFNRLVELSCADVARPARTEQAPSDPPAAIALKEQEVSRAGNNHVRMPEIERRTGLSRATIYRRIEQGRFPRQIPMDGNIAAWWESDVAAWLADPR